MTDKAMSDNQVKRYVHQPLTFEHNGTQVTIKENGRVILKAVSKDESTDNEIVYDEIDVPASLIFKVASALRVTRNVQFIDKK